MSLVRLRRSPPAAARPSTKVPMVRLDTGALGYLGARADDRAHWLTGFRRLLDGLDRPLQVIL